MDSKTPILHWSTAVVAAFWGLSIATLGTLGMLNAIEDPFSDLSHRLFDGTEPSGKVWVVVIDAESLRRLRVPDDAELWRRLLERARLDGAARVIDLDSAAAPAVAQALKDRAPGPPVLIVPSRMRIDPYFETPSGVDRPFAGLEVSDAGHVEGLLHLKPDPDGTWRHVTFRENIRGQQVDTLAAKLAPAGIGDRRVARLAFTGPAGSLPSVSAWRLIEQDLGEPPWRDGTLVVTRSQSIPAATVWTPYGQELSEPRAVAQIAESLSRDRIYSETPWWVAGFACFFLFIVAVLAASKASPRLGLITLGTGSAALLAGLTAAYIRALWMFPLVPIVPTLLVGFVVGLNQRHRFLQRGLSAILVELGGSRVLHPLMRKSKSDEIGVRRLLELLQVEGVAVIGQGQENPVAAAAASNEGAFFERVRDASAAMLHQVATTRTTPVFYRPNRDDRGAIVIPLAIGRANENCLVIQPADHAEVWWQSNRDFASRMLLPIASHVAGNPAEVPDLSGTASIAPEKELGYLHSTVLRTEGERTFMLGLLNQMSEGVLVCDLLGRVLLYNSSFEQTVNLMGPTSKSTLAGVLQFATGRDESTVWKTIYQVVRGRVPWKVFASLKKPETRNLFMNLSLLDLGGGTEQRGNLEVLALVVTEVTSIQNVEKTKLERMTNISAMFGNAYQVLSRTLDALQALLNPQGEDRPLGSTLEESLRGIKEDMDAVRAPLSSLAQQIKSNPEELTTEVEPVDLVAEIGRAIAEASTIASELGIGLQREGGDMVAMALARREPLRRALTMAIEQSVASSPQGSTITLGAFDRGNEVELHIRDSGWKGSHIAPNLHQAAAQPGKPLPARELLNKTAAEAGARIEVVVDESGATSVKFVFPRVI